MPYPLDTIPSAREWFKTADGCQHFLRVWTANNSQAVLLYLHGIEGHSLWFAETAQALCQSGITVYAADRRGSGMSEERRGDITSWKTFIDDAEQLIKHLNNRHKNEPFFLAGGCWGAKVTAVVATKQKAAERLKGLIFSSPAFTVKVDLKLPEKLLLLWRLAAGNLIPIPIPLTAEHFTNNPDYLSFIENDKQRLLAATARFFAQSQILGWLATNSASQIQLPLLVLQAEHDEIVQISGLQRWFSQLKSKDRELNIIPGTRHSLDFDYKRAEYREALIQWILTRATRAQTPGERR